MTGALTGHGATFPAPHIINAAFHAALHRAGIASHKHHSGNYRTRDYSDDSARKQLYGSLKTIGPFPVRLSTDAGTTTAEWFVPAPADDAGFKLLEITAGTTSLPAPLTHAFLAVSGPTKEKRPNWHSLTNPQTTATDADIFDAEDRIGIGIDSATGSQDGERFYTSQILRLRDNWRLGILVSADDKEHGDLITGTDGLLARARHLVLGGNQGLAAIERATAGADDILPALPEIPPAAGKIRIRWTLLSPAIFPKLKNHPGGWLPNWINPTTGAVLLPQTIERKPGESRADWRARVQSAPFINARLIAALVDKPVPVTGWALGNPPTETTAGNPTAGNTTTVGSTKTAGAKPTHFAVPAGSVYVFEADTSADANALVRALHLVPRSTLLGEKGYGLGLCAQWQDAAAQSSATGTTHERK
jgi:hypothetical protein